ncbi:sll0787 family AIR synthase-like protein [Burkholderia sp. Ax-1719]|uniref:sll0787 family AIR synthase-like protein n=1 Tax=Burkholderia sp. Ax-1719 TaxID=2608334 RepID=UPI00141F11D7|nr:sll0787 family AIR synthase-like protein [Burkholderia sp. Ax-1719]NIE64285.1 sll0787 family AIR synthase-like protein [Burkholderia sp. Ax-1719]
MTLDEIVASVRASRGVAHKTDIAPLLAALSRDDPTRSDEAAVMGAGDDCAALPDGDGWLLFAAEGMVSDLIEAMPWFAGYCSVLVNVSDVCAMGGRPLAVVDVIWSKGLAPAAPVLEGMAAAARQLGVPIVGGHSNARSERTQLAVAILGRAKRLLSSFAARPGDRLMMAVDLRGAFVEPYPYWNAATEAPAERIRGDLALLAQIAEEGLCESAKDISMAGIAGTAMMLAECSRVGVRIDLERVPRPADVDLSRWMQIFPSFGYLLSVAPRNVDAVRARFEVRGIACDEIGEIHAEPTIDLSLSGEIRTAWRLDEQAFIVPADRRSTRALDVSST